MEAAGEQSRAARGHVWDVPGSPDKSSRYDAQVGTGHAAELGVDGGDLEGSLSPDQFL
jgi:hypothetical protein